MKTPGLLITILLAAFTLPAVAAAQASASAGASASIVSAGGIGEVSGPNFASTRSPQGSDASAAMDTATYALSGPTGQTASIQVSESVPLRQVGSQARLMATFDVLRLNASDVGGAATRNLLVTGAVNVSQRSSPGLYTGTLTLMVGYN